MTKFYEIHNNNLIIKLAIRKTDCKAKSVCGVPEKVVELAENVSERLEPCCTADGNCC